MGSRCLVWRDSRTRAISSRSRRRLIRPWGYCETSAGGLTASLYRNARSFRHIATGYKGIDKPNLHYESTSLKARKKLPVKGK